MDGLHNTARERAAIKICPHFIRSLQLLRCHLLIDSFQSRERFFRQTYTRYLVQVDEAAIFWKLCPAGNNGGFKGFLYGPSSD